MSNELKQLDINENSESSTTEIEQHSNKPRKFYTDNGLFWFVLFFGLFFVTFVFVFQVVLTPIKIIGSSMQPTLNMSITSELDDQHSDIVYLYKEKSYNKNDIVVVANTDKKYIPEETGVDVEFMIKRVIATGGEQIEFTMQYDSPRTVDGERRYYYDIKVLDSLGNDTHLNQNYLEEDMYFTERELISSGYKNYKDLLTGLRYNGKYTIKVSENHYFVMGDNRNNSTDSRFFGEIAYDDISGSVKLIVPYGKSIFSSIWKTIFNTKFIIMNNLKFYQI